MFNITKEQAGGAVLVGLGAARMASGVMTGLGLGIVGGMLRHHHMMVGAKRIGLLSIEGGKNMVDEGLRDLRRAAR